MDANSDNNKKYFDTKNFSTLVVGQENDDHVKNNGILSLIAANDTVVKENALRLIKSDTDALNLLITAINNKTFASHKTALIAACWESGIDCRPKLNYFVNLAIVEEYLACLEAFSVVDGMDMPVNQNELDKSIYELNSGIEKASGDKKELLIQLLDVLNSYKE